MRLDADDAFVPNLYVGRLNYKTADWRAFATQLFFTLGVRPNVVPTDRNITNEEIDRYVLVLQNNINEHEQRQICELATKL